MSCAQVEAIIVLYRMGTLSRQEHISFFLYPFLRSLQHAAYIPARQQRFLVSADTRLHT